MSREVLYLTADDTRKLLDMEGAMKTIEDVYRWHARDRVVWSEPGTSIVNAKDLSSKYRVKGCYLPEIPVVGMRIVGYHIAADGSGSSSPESTRYVLLSDPRTGSPIAMIDEHWNYSLRTSASAAVGVKYMARRDSHVVGLVGAGNLATTMLMALTKLYQLAEVRVTSRRQESRTGFAARMTRQLGVDVRPVDTVEEAVREADIVVTATTTKTPLVQFDWLAEGVCLCTLGHYEAAEEVYKRTDKIVVDSWEVSKDIPDMKAMLKEGAISRDRVYAEIQDLVAGLKPGRTVASERVLVRADGLVSQDVALAHYVYRLALDNGLGAKLQVG